MYCTDSVQERIGVLEERLRSIEESRNNETKSSAGDKYETGRAMAQIEADKCRGQLAQAHVSEAQLKILDIENTKENIQNGSLVQTDKGVYFISIGLGRVKLEEGTYFCISAASPIGKILLGKKQGDSFVFNNIKSTVKAVL